MINLLPYRQKKMMERIRGMRVFNTTLFAIIVLTAIGAMLYVPSLVTINSRYALAQNEITRLETQGMVTDAKDVAAYDVRVSALVAKLAAPLPTAPTAHIAIVQQAVMSGITLSGFAMDKTATPIMNVSGTATTRQALQQFVETLKAKDTIKSVDSPISNYVKSTNDDFTITITFTD